MKPATPFKLNLLLLVFGFTLFFGLNTAQAQARMRTADCPQYEQRQANRPQQKAFRQNTPGQRGKKAAQRNGQRLNRKNYGKNPARVQGQNQFGPRRQGWN